MTHADVAVGIDHAFMCKDAVRDDEVSQDVGSVHCRLPGWYDPARNDRPLRSEEDAQVLGRQHVLIKDHPAACDLPRAVDTPQPVLAGADIEILLGLAAAAVDDEIAVDRQLRL